MLRYLWIFPLLLFLLFSCKKAGKGPAWDINMSAPLLHGSVDIRDIVADSVLGVSDDSSFNLVYKNPIYSLNLAEEVIEIPDTSLGATLRLDSLVMSDVVMTNSVSLGQMAQEAGVVGQAIIASDGDSSTIPPLSGLSSDDIDVDATSYFETATFQQGWMDITLNNELPIELTNVVFQIRNKVGGEIIVKDTFASVPAFTSITSTYDLKDKTAEGTLLATLLNMDSPGSSDEVLIDTSDVVEIIMKIYDIRVKEATAIFPEQNIIDHKDNVVYDMRGAEYDFLRIREGKLEVSVISTVEDSIYVNYRIPKAIDQSGQPLNMNTVAPPAPSGGSITKVEIYDLAGFEIDLTGEDGTQYNTFFNTLTARIDSTGRLITMTLEDSLIVKYELKEIVPEYLHGYMGKHTLNVGPESTLFNPFKNIVKGALDLEKITLTMDVVNGLGVSGNFILNSLKSYNSKTNTTVALASPSLVGVSKSIGAATDNPLTPDITTFVLDETNSNADQLIENFPDRIDYALDVFINPNGNTSGHNEFVYFSNGLDVTLDMEIPLSFKANELTLSDTLEFSLGESEEIKIKDGIISLIAYNGFPLDANVQLYLYDDLWNLVDTVFVNSMILAADLNSSCRVSSPVRSKLDMPVDEQRIEQLRMAKYAIVKAAFSNSGKTCQDQYLKIYSDYHFDFKLVGKFNYHVQTDF